MWRARPTGTLHVAKTDVFLLYYVSSYVQNRFGSQLLVKYRVDTFPMFFTEDLLFPEKMTFLKL